MAQVIDWEQLTEDFFGKVTRGQALLVHESRRGFARELILAINVLSKQGAASSLILQAVIHSCEVELMRADQP